MTFAERIARDAQPGSTPLPGALFAPIDSLLVSGGDARLALQRPSPQNPSRRNAYGCTPHPQSGLIDFSSSTASSISEQAYARVAKARDEFMARMIAQGTDAAFDDGMTANRQALLRHLDLTDSGVDVVFSASGTDAQIQALFLVKTLLGTPLTTVIAGADQTGSGTVHTARGRHFSDRTAGGEAVVQGGPIGALAEDVRSVAISFRDAEGGFRAPAEMDKAVLAAVAETAAQDGNVLLQAMDCSKFGWRAPSDSCLDDIARRWPGQVQIVVDACQLRLSRARLKSLLAKGCIVLITGSKYFTGPAFSGALLVPRRLGAATLAGAGDGLAAYSSRYDWPKGWVIRSCLAPVPNWGLWLRWEAALEEMRLYYAVPEEFRHQTRARLAQSAQDRIAASANLVLLPSYPGSEAPTIFSFVPQRNGVPLSLEACGILYRALSRDLRIVGGGSATSALCQIGQPVALKNGAALRVALSARTLRQCWSDDPALAEARIAEQEAGLSLLVEKLDFCLGHFDAIAGLSP